jgi:hypothetical protein
MKKPITFKQVAHLYLGCRILDLPTNTHHRLHMIGIDDPAPILVDGEWRSFEEIKPVLYTRDDLPVFITEAKKKLDQEHPEFWAHLTLFYCSKGVDCFGLLESGEAVLRPNLTKFS